MRTLNRESNGYKMSIFKQPLFVLRPWRTSCDALRQTLGGDITNITRILGAHFTNMVHL